MLNYSRRFLPTFAVFVTRFTLCCVFGIEFNSRPAVDRCASCDTFLFSLWFSSPAYIYGLCRKLECRSLATTILTQHLLLPLIAATSPQELNFNLMKKKHKKEEEEENMLHLIILF